MSDTASSDAGVMAVVGGILGVAAGFGAAMFVIGHNEGYYQTEYRKQMVELGVGYYDARTGGFQVKACSK